SLPRGMPGDPARDALGGRVHFARRPDGQWIVDDWKIRMPLSIATTRSGDTRLTRYREVGGSVQTNGTTVEQPLKRATTVNVSGSVFDSLTSAPAIGAIVKLEGTSFSAMTGSDGRFAFTEVPLGAYTLTFTTPALDSLGVRAASSLLDVSAPGTLLVRLTLPSLVTRVERMCPDVVDLRREGVVRLRVVDAMSGEPIGDTPIRASWRQYVSHGTTISELPRDIETRLDANGESTLCGLPGGTTVLLQSTAGATKRWRETLRVDEGSVAPRLLRVQSVVARGVGTSSTVAEEARIRGRVVDATTRRPLADAVVSIAGETDSSRTNTEGVFTLRSSLPGSLQIVVRRLGYRPLTADTGIRASEQLNLAFALERAPRTLENVTVAALGDRSAGRVSELFEKHRASGFGRFLTEDSLRSRDVSQTSDLLRGVGGIRFVELPQGGRAAAAITPPTPTLYPFIDRWSSPGEKYHIACYMQVILNGTRAWTWGAQPPIDIESFPVNSLAAVEVYRTAGETPPEFGGTGSTCGTVVFWSRTR
ncbi:MAG: carboxypeptidase regulatory-like domain-containing protein, partial [Gemmatimonadaceae bacterium]